MRIEIVWDLNGRLAEDNQYANEVLKGRAIDKSKAKKALLVTPELFAKLFSPERIKLLIKISKEGEDNIYQLAKSLHRKYEAVFRDVKLLEGYGLIFLKPYKRGRIPVLEQPVKMPSFEAG